MHRGAAVCTIAKSDTSGTWSVDAYETWLSRGYSVTPEDFGRTTVRPKSSTTSQPMPTPSPGPAPVAPSAVARTNDLGISIGACYVGCAELGNDHFGLGLGPRANLDVTGSVGWSSGRRAGAAASISFSCGLSVGLGGYVEGEIFAAGPRDRGVPSFQYGYGATAGAGAGCSIMANYYWE